MPCWIPYHMNCRTSIRGVFKSQVGKPGNIVDNPTMKSLKSFKPQKGFGGKPLDIYNRNYVVISNPCGNKKKEVCKAGRGMEKVLVPYATGARLWWKKF